MKRIILPLFIAAFFMSSCKKESTSLTPAITSQAKVKPCSDVPLGVGFEINPPIYQPDNFVIISIFCYYRYYINNF
jgi:hypothetical protein